MTKQERKSQRVPERSVRKPAGGQWPNEGEGNKSADRRYREETKRFVKSGRVEKQAAKAAEALDSPEQRDLVDAEAKGRGRAR